MSHGAREGTQWKPVAQAAETGSAEGGATMRDVGGDKVRRAAQGEGTEAFARKQSMEPTAAPLSLGRAQTPAATFIKQPSPWSKIDTKASLEWARERWPELLLPIGVAIGLWALLAT